MERRGSVGNIVVRFVGASVTPEGAIWFGAGDKIGMGDGTAVVGSSVGVADGRNDGVRVGNREGESDGARVGRNDGFAVG